jgi:hypothetical protein
MEINQMRNAILGLVVLLAASAGTARAQQSPPTIKGVSLGEFVSDYIAKTPGGAEQLQNCRTAQVDPKAAKKLKLDLAVCESFIAAVDRGSRVQFGRPGDFMKITFDQGRVVKIEYTIDFSVALKYGAKLEKQPPTYEQVIADLTAKFGQPFGQNVIELQNGFGARFEHRNTIWKTADAVVTALELDANIQNPITAITVETPAEDANQKSIATSRPNSLD